jgi:membrane protein
MIAWLRALIARVKQLVPTIMALRPVRALTRYNDLRGNRLAGAVSFFGFVSLFPLLALAGAITIQVVGEPGVATLQEIVNENIPGLEIDISGFADRAGTIGLIGGITLLWTGLSWVDATRAAVRSMWELNDAPGNPVVRKLVDLAALIGLGAIFVVSWGASVMVDAVADHMLDWLGIAGGPGEFTSRAVALTLAIASSSVLFGYLLAGLPRISIPPRVLLVAALVGGLTFEVFKQLITQFAIVVAPNNMYAAFAVPLALLAWIYLVTRLLMGLAAATAEWAADHPPPPPSLSHDHERLSST